MADQTSAVIDSLKTFNPKDLSTRNRHYYVLLSSIGEAWSGKYDHNDSALQKALSWYRSNSDYRNVCRAIIYNMSDLDGQFLRLTEAEKLLKKHKINDSLTEAYLYMYLSEAVFRSSAGVSLSKQSAARQSESYKRMSVDMFMKLGRLREAQNLLINSYNKYPLYMTPENRLDYLKDIESFDTIYPEVKSKLLLIYSNYFFSSGDKRGFSYLHEYLDFEGDDVYKNKEKLQALVTLSDEYKKVGKLDSALYFAKLYNARLIELHADAYEGYRLLSSVYEAMGETAKAYENHLMYHKVFSYRKSAQYQDVLLQKRKESQEYDSRIKKLKRERAFALYGTVLFMGALFAAITLFIFKNRRGILGNALAEEEYKAQLSGLEELYKKSKFTNEVMKVSAGLMPSFVDAMAKEAGRCRKISQDTFDNILNQISSMRQSGRDIIAEIAKSEDFADLFPEIAAYRELSSYEKVVLALFEMGYSPKEISNLISTTPASVRSIKAKIKDKLPSLFMSGEVENQTEDD